MKKYIPEVDGEDLILEEYHHKYDRMDSFLNYLELILGLIKELRPIDILPSLENLRQDIIEEKETLFEVCKAYLYEDDFEQKINQIEQKRCKEIEK